MTVDEKEIITLDPLRDTGKHLVKKLLERLDEVQAQNDEILRRERERDEREKTRPDLVRLIMDALRDVVGKYDAWTKRK